MTTTTTTVGGTTTANVVMPTLGNNSDKFLVEFSRKGSLCEYDNSLVWRVWAESKVPGVGGTSTFVFCVELP